MTSSRSRRRAPSGEEAMSMKGTGDYRAAIEAVGREVSLLSELEREAVADGTTLAALRASWGELLGHLAPGLMPGLSASGHRQEEGMP